MPSFGGLLIVVAVAFAVPLVLGLFPAVRLPSVVLEILAGIVIGPSVLGIVHVDQTIQVIAVIGLAFLLFLAGLEIDFSKLRGQVLRLTLAGFAASFGIAVVVALLLKTTGLIDFGAVILLSIFFSGEGGVGSTLLLIGGLVLLAIVVFVAVRGAEHSMTIRSDLLRLQDTTAQIRVRGAVVLLVGFAAIAETLGLETILGAFMAGAILSLLDRDQAMTHPDFRRKLEAIGFGVFIPVFFVTSGVNYDLNALVASASNVIIVPIFLAALVLARGLPVLLYRRVLDGRQTVVAGLMQATSLPFIVAATAIGLDLNLLTAAEGAALIGAGLLSVLLFPIIGLTLLTKGDSPAPGEPGADEPEPMMAM